MAISAEKRAAIERDLLEADQPRCGATARRHGVANGTVKRIADSLGVTFDRAPTENASQARSADMRADRGALAVDVLKEARGMLRKVVEAPRAAWARDYAVAFGILVDKHAALIELDAGEPDASPLDAIAVAIGRWAERTPAERHDTGLPPDNEEGQPTDGETSADPDSPDLHA